LDFVVDRSIKRPVDVERHLRLPVFLTIPDTTWSTGLSLPWTSNERDGGGAQLAQTAVENGCTDVAIWDPESPLRPYSEGLRERLMTYFEVRNMNLKKPKLVGVTACNKGAGVSTLASGLAAELSKTGDGNVLLVDVNGDEGMAHPFHRGKPGCGLSDALEPEARAEAQVERNLFVASMMNGQTPSLSPVVPTRFSQMVPKMKASDYDYIIFDMPPVSAISTTPRLASHMDLVLLVLESEQTGQQLAARANTLMGESRANVAAVLNKFRSHVPAPLSQEG
jgi:Mrp family chromosome partitioning ATPase